MTDAVPVRVLIVDDEAPARSILREMLSDRDGVSIVGECANGFEAVKAALEAAGLKPDVAEVTMRAENTIALSGEDGQRMQKLLDMIEDLDDVQELYHNAEISE